ncbi:hypothetical protein MPTK2_7g00720 [Marchantia polymorpha subsp. ruderalis]
MCEDKWIERASRVKNGHRSPDQSFPRHTRSVLTFFCCRAPGNDGLVGPPPRSGIVLGHSEGKRRGTMASAIQQLALGYKEHGRPLGQERRWQTAVAPRPGAPNSRASRVTGERNGSNRARVTESVKSVREARRPIQRIGAASRPGPESTPRSQRRTHRLPPRRRGPGQKRESGRLKRQKRQRSQRPTTTQARLTLGLRDCRGRRYVLARRQRGTRATSFVARVASRLVDSTSTNENERERERADEDSGAIRGRLDPSSRWGPRHRQIHVAGQADRRTHGQTDRHPLRDGAGVREDPLRARAATLESSAGELWTARNCCRRPGVRWYVDQRQRVSQ